ncbi:MAG: hypothetical protein GY696_20055 [Gammaproteobacteria bacterium]|nr:hypothetical protein [Gammaproteobacteria bacterium]
MTVNKSFTVHPSCGNVGNIPVASVCSFFPASDEVQQLNPGPLSVRIGSLAEAFPVPVGLLGDHEASLPAGRWTFECSAGQEQGLGQDIQ